MTDSANKLSADVVVTACLLTMRPIRLELSAFQAFTLVEHLQLALRHPDGMGPSAETATFIAKGLQQTLSLEDKNIAILLDAGWHLADDVPAEERAQ